MFECPNTGKRVIKSNGLPDHDITIANPNDGCEIPWQIEMPLVPTYVSATIEPPTLGIVAMAINGVPIYGASEGDAGNAVEPAADASVTDAQHWYGHAAQNGDWHYHAPEAGNPDHTPAVESTQIGYALDGFKIFGPLSDSDAANLDICNGRNNLNTGEYQYHVKSKDQIDENLEYCPDASNDNNSNWNYILGCYHGDMSESLTTSWSGDIEDLPYGDCELVAI